MADTLNLMNMKPNYRIYDRTGGGATKDIYAPTLEAAIDAGREWIEDGNWKGEDGVIRKGVTLDACVRPIVLQPIDPAEKVNLAGVAEIADMCVTEWDSGSKRWYVDVSVMDGDRVNAAAALTEATGGRWEYVHEAERCEWVEVPAEWPTEDITDDQQENDCSGSYSDDEPECESEGPGDDDGGHDWRSPLQPVGRTEG